MAGEFGDTVVCMVPSNVENQRVNRHVGADRPVRAELVEDERATLAYVDRVAGIKRFVEIGPEATARTWLRRYSFNSSYSAGLRVGGSQAPVVKSLRSASGLSRPHFRAAQAAVARATSVMNRKESFWFHLP
jgi:hypothetical protein